MLPKTRHAFLPLALLLPLTACSEQVVLEPSERLESLLLPSSDYPDGFEVETIDLDEVDGSGGGGTDFDSIEPAACEEAFEDSPADVPEEAAEGAGQVAVSSGSSPTFYTYALVSGDFDETQDASDYEAMLSSCSTMTAVSDGITMEGSIRGTSFPSLPDQGDAFTMDLSADGLDMTMWTAWGQVADVHFVLIGMDLGSSPDVNASTLARECFDDRMDTECRDRLFQEAADEARAAQEEEFDEVLAAAVALLESDA
ncbi:hypothetical protein [Nocardiopsis alba]|uniref:hypothetical protein n=1 Tax=Nocardiopsis alba TaxID=53437 RepID=UPI003D7302CA